MGYFIKSLIKSLKKRAIRLWVPSSAVGGVFSKNREMTINIKRNPKKYKSALSNFFIILFVVFIVLLYIIVSGVI